MRNPFKRKQESVPKYDVAAPEEDPEDTQRGYWGRQLDFVLTLIGYAVGFGNVWRFPYLCMRNGGGAFLIPYFSVLFLCGIPLFYLELVIGQFASLSPLQIWNICPLFTGLGWGAVVVTALVSVYYNVIIAWVLFYLASSFKKTLPWSTCTNSWNTQACSHRNSDLLPGNSTNITGLSLNVTSWMDTVPGNLDWDDNLTHITYMAGNTTDLHHELKYLTPSEEFWQYRVLDISSGIDEPDYVRWELALCLLLSWVITFLILSKGVKTLGKVVYVTATCPYVLLTVLLIRGLMLPGATDGIKFYIIPDFKQLTKLKVWAEACLQIFYSLGPGWGGLITMASYNKFNNNCFRDAMVVPIVNCGSSFFAGFVIFSILGHMAKEANLSVNDVVTSGPGLTFVAYPEAISKLPISPFWAVLFFITLLIIGFNTQFGNVETVSSGLVDLFPRYLSSRKTSVCASVCTAGFLLGLPCVTRAGVYIFQIMDWYCAAFSVMVIALLECIALFYIYGWKRLSSDIEMMLGKRPGYWWAVTWGFITPAMMLVIIVYSSFNMAAPTYGVYHYPSWAIGFGWSLAMMSIVPLPICMLVLIAREKGSILQRIKKLSQPTDTWGPAAPKFKAIYKYAKCEPLSELDDLGEIKSNA